MLEELDQGRQVLFYKFSIELFGLLSVMCVAYVSI